jgi:hypothetical protein
MPEPIIIKLDMEVGPDKEMTLIDFRSHWVKGQVHSDLECENVSSDNLTMPVPMALKSYLELCLACR